MNFLFCFWHCCSRKIRGIFCSKSGLAEHKMVVILKWRRRDFKVESQFFWIRWLGQMVLRFSFSSSSAVSISRRVIFRFFMLSSYYLVGFGASKTWPDCFGCLRLALWYFGWWNFGTAFGFESRKSRKARILNLYLENIQRNSRIVWGCKVIKWRWGFPVQIVW